MLKLVSVYMCHTLHKYAQRNCSNATFPLGLDLWFDLAGETKGADPIRTAGVTMRSPNDKNKKSFGIRLQTWHFDTFFFDKHGILST